MQKRLQESLRNQELLQMMQLEKSLVYFSTSLKGNEIVLEKMMRMDMLRKYPDDADLLEDVIIENKQAIEMCAIYRDIMSGTMDAYASIISNNLNIVMKVLTSLTVMLAIPTLFASFWGMNTGVPYQGSIIGFWLVFGLSAAVTIVTFFNSPMAEDVLRGKLRLKNVHDGELDFCQVWFAQPEREGFSLTSHRSFQRKRMA